MYYNRVLGKWVLTLYDEILFYWFGTNVFLLASWFCFQAYIRRRCNVYQQKNNYRNWNLESSLALLDLNSYKCSTTKLRCLHVYFFSMENNLIAFPQFALSSKNFGLITQDLAKFEFNELKNRKSNFRHMINLLQMIVSTNGGANATQSQLPPENEDKNSTNGKEYSNSPSPTGIGGIGSLLFYQYKRYLALLLMAAFRIALEKAIGVNLGPQNNKTFAQHIVNGFIKRFLEFIEALSGALAPPNSAQTPLICFLIGLAMSLVTGAVHWELIASLKTLPALTQIYCAIGGAVIGLLNAFLGLLVVQQYGMDSLQFLLSLLPGLVKMLQRLLEYALNDPTLFEGAQIRYKVSTALRDLGIDSILRNTYSNLYTRFLDNEEHLPFNTTSTESNEYFLTPLTVEEKVPPIASPHVSEPMIENPRTIINDPKLDEMLQNVNQKVSDISDNEIPTLNKTDKTIKIKD